MRERRAEQRLETEKEEEEIKRLRERKEEEGLHGKENMRNKEQVSRPTRETHKREGHTSASRGGTVVGVAKEAAPEVKCKVPVVGEQKRVRERPAAQRPRRHSGQRKA